MNGARATRRGLLPRLHLGARASATVLILGAALPTGACAAQSAAGAPRQESAQESAGVVTMLSAVSFDSTLARLERAATANGLTIAARVDHAAAAARAGLTLRPTTLLIAGNPAAGTPLMQSRQAVGVDLPLRFLVWQDGDGRVHVTYNTIASIAARHGITGRDPLIAKMTTGIETIVKMATSPP